MSKKEVIKKEIKKENLNPVDVYSQILIDKDKERKTYLYSFASGIMNMFILIVAILFVSYSFVYTPQAQYILADEDGRIIEDKPLNEFNMTNEEMGQWLTQAIKKSFAYDFTGVDLHPSKIKNLYTEKGFADFKSQFDGSADVVLVVKNQAVSSVSRITPPKIKKQGYVNKGAVAVVQFESSMVQMFQGYAGLNRETYKVTALIVRKNIKDYKDGIAIESIIRERIGE
jgi:hypothetical protein